MCKELEAAGLQDPEYKVNAFILQTTIRNSSFPSQKPPIEEQNHGLIEEKPLIEEKNHGLAEEKPLIEEEYKMLLLQRVEKAVTDKKITPIVAQNINKVIETFAMNQIWGRKEIRTELRYGDSKAGVTIENMQALNIIVPVIGKGKGKYILKKFV